MRWRVDLTETVTYQVTVDADTVEEAHAAAIEAHIDGISIEIDNAAPEVEQAVRL